MALVRAPQWLKNLVGDTLAQLFSFASSTAFKVTLWILAPLLAPVYFIVWLISTVHEKFNAMMAAAIEPTGMVTQLSAGSMLSMANAFFPIDDVAILLPILLSLSLAAYAYRLIKSFIPTLS